MESAQRPRILSDIKREHEVLRLGPAFRNIPYLDLLGASSEDCALPDDHVARPSSDAALNAFCQLAAVRLNARRALISLIDDRRQHVLAEATPSMSLRRSISPSQPADGIWLGNVSIPRTWGVCEEVLNLTSYENAVVIIDDLAQVDKFVQRTYVRGAPNARFYAGVGLLSPHGAVVGALCIFDDKPRQGIPREDVLYLSDLAATIAEHLETYVLKDSHMRGERLLRGLTSFVEGASSLHPGDVQTDSSLLRTPVNLSSDPLARHGCDMLPATHEQDQEVVNASGPDTAPEPSGHKSLRTLQENILPPNTRLMFSRAAGIMRASSELDGVVILDASVASTTDSAAPTDPTASLTANNSDENVSEDNDDGQQRLGKRCQILGKSTRENGGINFHSPIENTTSLLETHLGTLLRQFPAGRVIHFSDRGEAVGSVSESDSSYTSPVTTEEHDPLPKRKRRRNVTRWRETLDAIRLLLPKARSVAFVPLWDFERSRWFAGCLCWTHERLRAISPQLDLVYFKVFGNSIMNELSKLDRIATDQVKTNFRASLSHELRTPLNGIMGSLEFLRETPLDIFQSSMLHSLSACGHTLLDTVDHLLDHAKADEPRRTISTKRLEGENTVQLTSKVLKSLSLESVESQAFATDLSLTTEQVVEAVFSAHLYRVQSKYSDESLLSSEALDMSDTASSYSTRLEDRKRCYIVLDLAQQQHWDLDISPGSWRRIVMNIFSNALKYTNSGSISVSLRIGDQVNDDHPSHHVIFTVSDSGIGMSPAFLANKLFQPFTQEDPHSPGIGLGLSIVRQIIETIGGSIQVTSHSHGSQLTIKLALRHSGRLSKTIHSSLREAHSRLDGRTICILSRHASSLTESNAKHQSLLVKALAITLKSCLDVAVVETSTWEQGIADIVVCPEPFFDFVAQIRGQRNMDGKPPATVFIAMDGIEAAALRSDVRITSAGSIVEILTQPCGPSKLVSTLLHCLDRRESFVEVSHHSPVQSTDQLNSVEEGAHGVQMQDNCSDPAPQEKDTPTRPAASPWDRRYSQSMGPEPEIEPKNPPGILIVDDNPVNRKLLVAFMNKRRYNYYEAQNGLEAVNVYSNIAYEFDMVLMDISMPVMDGLTATRAIREHEKKNGIKRGTIIALTGLTSDNARLEAWNAGVDHFMTKPINFKKLAKLLEPKKHEEVIQ
ncbi:hypothetical protein EJ04DRAFT_484532 [Polyplosphaeria fusca]|uniref:histidine kinase n=1 Tax=Polyplosphaeria fusca TaxID=682080 RepID=A0A9P4R9W4_9PLEO|nr:hypothetical protein EJ04DRAFT_484532 [Polyplosphaeria fusca]